MIKTAKYGGKPGARSWRALARLAFRSADAEAVREWVGWFAGAHGDGGEMAAAIELARRVARGLTGADDAAGLTGRVEAESVAFLIALRLGLDTSGFAFPHVGSWSGTDPRVPAASIVAAAGERILAAASKAFVSIDADLGEATRLVTGPRLASKDTAVRPVLPEVPARTQAAAGRYFARHLDGSWVPGYLDGRGFDGAVQRQWGIGYAPGGWTGLTDYLRKLGFGDRAIEASGLAVRCARGTLIDVFRDRAMFPVRSVDGAVVGFLGRAVPGAGKNVPKYLNTRETGRYRKGRVLFGLHEGRPALGEGACPVIVEGPLDAIAVTAAGGGRYVGVAPCGTALTVDQVLLLSRFTTRGPAGPVVAFDGDQAGREAAVRTYELLRGPGARPLAVEFPDGQDPAGLFASSGASALARVLETRVHPLADVVIDAKIGAFGHWLEFVEGKFNALHAVAPLIAQVPADDVARQVARVADRLGLTYAEVTAGVTDALHVSSEAAPGDEPGQASIERSQHRRTARTAARAPRRTA